MYAFWQPGAMNRCMFGRDSDLEAFSHMPSDGSFAPLAFQPST
jgi:hypothetical protein